MIPTIGRKVWYRNDRTMHVHSDQPCDATVIYVWNDSMVSLDVTDHAGNRHIRTSVRLVEPGTDTSSFLSDYAEWMPYQVQQAKKEGV
jgi:hypothetical protein